MLYHRYRDGQGFPATRNTQSHSVGFGGGDKSRDSPRHLSRVVASLPSAPWRLVVHLFVTVQLLLQPQSLQVEFVDPLGLLVGSLLLFVSL
jgi:hypothetical protein